MKLENGAYAILGRNFNISYVNSSNKHIHSSL